MSGFKLIDHTADIGISVSGKTLKQLYLNAAKGLVAVVFKCRSVEVLKSERTKKIKIFAVDKDQLLVKWLQEVLFLINAKQFVPTGFKILSLTEQALKAHVNYIPFDAQIHDVRHEVKAVTYHELSIKKSGGQFRATVIFDI